MSPTFRSKKKWDEDKPTYPPLPDDDYRLRVSKIEQVKAKKYMSEELQDVMRLTLELQSYADGSVANDTEGKPALGRRFYQDIRPNQEGEFEPGFTREGLPSIGRAIIAYVINKDPFDEITEDEFPSWDSLLGKEVVVSINQYVSKLTGDRKCKITRVVPRKVRKVAPKEDIPVINAKADGTYTPEGEEDIDPASIPF